MKIIDSIKLTILEIKPILRIVLRKKLSVVAICVTALLFSLSEGLGIVLLVPLLDGLGGQKATMMPFPLNYFSQMFMGIELAYRLRIVALLMVGVMLIKGLFGYLNSMLGMRIQVEVIKAHRDLSFKQILRLGMGYIYHQKTGEMQSYCIPFPSYLGGMVYQIAYFSPKFFTVIVYVAMLFLLSWKLSLLAIGLLIVASLVVNKVISWARTYGEKTQKAMISLNSFFIESFSGLKVTHLFNRENDALTKFEDRSEELKKSEYLGNRTGFIFSPAMEIVSTLGLAAIMIVGSFVMLFSLQALLLFIYVLVRAMPPMIELNRIRINFASNIPFVNKVFKFLDEEDKIYIRNGSRPFTGIKQGIRLDQIKFNYTHKSARVLDNINLVISKGHKIGIVGPSGSGKSTLTELLLRFYDPQEGRILIDGIDLRDLDLVSWRKHIGVVTQDTFLFNDTVRANIGYALPQIDQTQIEDAARLAHAHDFIQKMPKGYDTVLGERGVLLSGGQKQRIAIARAILSGPEILVFDEATSALDTKSERVVQQALDEIGRGRTVITIAHRLSTIMDADLILVLEGGRIVQQGKHEDLLREEGVYRRLVKMQNLQGEQMVPLKI